MLKTTLKTISKVATSKTKGEKALHVATGAAKLLDQAKKKSDKKKKEKYE